MTKTLLAALLLFTIAILAGPPANAAQPPPPVYGPDLDLTASAWKTLQGWHNNVVKLRNDPAGNLYLDFPVMPDTSCAQLAHCESINYLFTTHVPGTISGNLVITLTVDTTGSPAFQCFTNTNNTGCGTPASVRPFIWSHNNSFSDGDRWWAHYVAYELAPGTVTLTVPLDPANFSGVFGEFANDNAQTLACEVDPVSLDTDLWRIRSSRRLRS